MSDIDAPVKLEQRTVVGKGLNHLRRDGVIPAVIHNFGQPSIHVMGTEMELARIYQAAGKHHPLNLEVGNDKFLALIKDTHFDPVKRRLQHVVFQAIKQDEKVEAEVPVHLEGEIPAEKVGLIVLHQLDAVEIEALPKDLPDVLTVDATGLAELHDKITVADIEAPAGVTILTDPEHPIATIAEPRAIAAEEAAAEEAEGEAAEGEEGAEGAPAEDGEGQPAAQEPSETKEQ